MTRDTRIVAIALASIAATISSASVICAWAISEGASPRWRLLFRVFCHGIAERSLSVFGEPMPICARCFGIYAGLLAGIAVYALLPWIRERTTRLVLLVAIFPIAIDGLTQAAGLRSSTNPLRIATGLMVAIAFSMWALSVVQHRDRNEFSTS